MSDITKYTQRTKYGLIVCVTAGFVATSLFWILAPVPADAYSFLLKLIGSIIVYAVVAGVLWSLFIFQIMRTW